MIYLVLAALFAYCCFLHYLISELVSVVGQNVDQIHTQSRCVRLLMDERLEDKT